LGGQPGFSTSDHAERERSQRVLTVLAPLVLLLYAVVFSLIGFDLVMALDPEWYSTLFGAYFFMSNFYLGLAVIAMIAVLARQCLKLVQPTTKKQLSDLGKLLFAFCLLTGYFLWSQYLVVWYGNLPEETGFVILRTRATPWTPVAWSILMMIFVTPFVVFLSRRVKESSVMVGAIALLIIVGMWLERYILIVPSLQPQEGFLFGWVELSISGGFFAAVALTYMAFLRFVPILGYEVSR
jgi:Ni/Fe-hydrogenase subunit HybB-like protein